MFREILSKIGLCLHNHALPYMIIGGQAVLIYGEPRLTRDIDITLGVNIDNLGTIAGIIAELGLKPIPDDVESFVKQTMVLPAIEEASGIRIDFIFSFTPYEEQAIKRSRKIAILGQDVSFASPEDVIIHKVFAGRPRDIEDARSIILKNPEIDTAYIRKWLSEFDASSDNNGFLKIFEDLMKS
ncbi:MAG: nucleotidyl transferase AbiEii/AbiGii toxin family protein [Planctomycetota bacterium]